MSHVSQFNESQIISDFFGTHVGFFVDCGASGGVALSNTFELGLKGWHGLLVEASPTHFANLVANYIHRGGFQFLNAAVWNERKMMEFNFNPGFYSSLIRKDEPGLYQNHYWVPTVIADDLKQIQPECDFLSLDIEGADQIVFPSMMSAYTACKLVCVEHANRESVREDWKRMLKDHGFTIIGETPENYIASR